MVGGGEMRGQGRGGKQWRQLVVLEQMTKGQLSIPETLCLLLEKVNHLTPTIQNLWVLTNALEQDLCKHAMIAPRITRLVE